MREGDVVLIRFPHASSAALKLRPALVLALLPGPYQNILICGVSTRLHQLEPDWGRTRPAVRLGLWDQRIAPRVFDPPQLSLCRRRRGNRRSDWFRRPRPAHSTAVAVGETLIMSMVDCIREEHGTHLLIARGFRDKNLTRGAAADEMAS